MLVHQRVFRGITVGNFSGSQATWDDKTSDIEALVAKHAEVPTLAEVGVGFEEKPAKETISMAIPGNIPRKYGLIWYSTSILGSLGFLQMDNHRTYLWKPFSTCPNKSVDFFIGGTSAK